MQGRRTGTGIRQQVWCAVAGHAGRASHGSAPKGVLVLSSLLESSSDSLQLRHPCSEFHSHLCMM